MTEYIDNINMEHDIQENKVLIEKTFVNLDYIKKELDEEIDLQEKDNVESGVAKFESIFVEDLDRRKIEDINTNTEFLPVNIDRLYCYDCGNSYGKDFECVLHILNSTVMHLKSELGTIPRDILEIRNTEMGKGVFVLKAIPKNVIFGPFEGVSARESTNRHVWKIEDNKLVSNESSNWMKYVVSSTNTLFKNLDIFQFDSKLYFRTNREIVEGEELSVHYSEEELQILNESRDYYFVPMKEETFPEIFICSLCCLGFKSNECLIVHKGKCSYVETTRNLEETIGDPLYETPFGKQEKYDADDYWQTSGTSSTERHEHTANDEISTYNDGNSNSKNIENNPELYILRSEYINKSDENYKCPQCTYQTHLRSRFLRHLNVHTGVKPFQCDICNKPFREKHNLKLHIKTTHEVTREKHYKCPQCSFRTYHKHNLRQHMNTHGDVRPFACDVCSLKFTQKSHLKSHIKAKHSERTEKDHKCPECSYQTDRRFSLTLHLSTHSDIKSFYCDTCKKSFSNKVRLKRHIEYQHLQHDAKDFKCPHCPYHTIRKDNLRKHLIAHSDVKQFQCVICKAEFNWKSSLQLHIKAQHSEEIGKCYKCIVCPYETNYKANLRLHMITHTDDKSLKCDECKKMFRHKQHLHRHIKNMHAKGCEKDFIFSNTEVIVEDIEENERKTELGPNDNIEEHQKQSWNINTVS